MFCKKCGTKNRDGARFCELCGGELKMANKPANAPQQAQPQQPQFTPQAQPQQPQFTPQAQPQQPQFTPQAQPQKPQFTPQAQPQKPQFTPQAQPQKPQFTPQAQPQQPQFTPQPQPQKPQFTPQPQPENITEPATTKRSKKPLGIIALILTIVLALGIGTTVFLHFQNPEKLDDILSKTENVLRKDKPKQE